MTGTTSARTSSPPWCSSTVASAFSPSWTTRRGNVATPVGVDPVDDHQRGVDGDAAGHDEDDGLGRVGVVEQAEQVGRSRCAPPPTSGSSSASAAGPRRTPCGRPGRIELGVHHAAVAHHDRAGATGHRVEHGPGAGRDGDGSGRAVGHRGEVVEVELVDAAVAPHLLVGGGHAASRRRLGRPGAPAAQPVGAGQRGGGFSGERRGHGRSSSDVGSGSAQRLRRNQPLTRRSGAAVGAARPATSARISGPAALTMSSASSSSSAMPSPSGSGGVGGVTSVPWRQSTSARRRSYDAAVVRAAPRCLGGQVEVALAHGLAVGVGAALELLALLSHGHGVMLLRGRDADGRQPTEPSIWSSMRRLHSTAYSIGSVRVTGSMKPFTTMPMACSSERPRLIR